MDEIDQRLDKFFNALYGDLADTERARRVRHELEKFISSVRTPDSPGKQGHETATTGR